MRALVATGLTSVLLSSLSSSNLSATAVTPESAGHTIGQKRRACSDCRYCRIRVVVQSMSVSIRIYQDLSGSIKPYQTLRGGWAHPDLRIKKIPRSKSAALSSCRNARSWKQVTCPWSVRYNWDITGTLEFPFPWSVIMTAKMCTSGLCTGLI